MVQQYTPPVYVVPAQKGGGGRGAVLIGSLIGMAALGGGYLLYSRYGLVRAKISDFTVSPTTVKAGDTIKATISWQNTGVKPYAFDVVIFFGDIKTMTGWGGLLPDVSSIPLEKQDTTISVTVPSDVIAQKYDAHAVICDATETDIGKVYALLTKQGLVTVEEGVPSPAGIQAFSMSKT